MNCGAYICISMMLAGDPMPAEVQTITEGPGWFSAAFSSDGKVIAAVRRQDPVRRGSDSTWHVALWNVERIDADSESVRTSASVTIQSGRTPTITAELQNCRDVREICFSPDGRLAVLGWEASANGYRVGKGKQSKCASPEEAKQAGRRVSRYRRPIIVFLDRDGLGEQNRWVNDNLGDHGSGGHASSLENLFWFAPAKSVVHFTHDGVRLLDEATGEEFERLTFERDRREDRWVIGGGDARVGRTNGSNLMIVATSRYRHGVWELDAHRKVTKIIEIVHPGIAGACAISPMGGVLALGALSENYEFGGAPPSVFDAVQRESTLELWKVEARKPYVSLHGHEAVAYDVDFAPDGKLLASVSWDQTMIVWDATTGGMLSRRPLDGLSFSVQFSRDGQHLLTASHLPDARKGVRICVWNVDRMLQADRAGAGRVKP